MKNFTRLVIRHKEFSSIPVQTFFFNDIEFIKKSLISLKKNNFSVKLRLDFDNIKFRDSFEILDYVLSLSEKEELRQCKNKKSLVLKFGEKYGI